MRAGGERGLDGRVTREQLGLGEQLDSREGVVERDADAVGRERIARGRPGAGREIEIFEATRVPVGELEPYNSGVRFLLALLVVLTVALLAEALCDSAIGGWMALAAVFSLVTAMILSRLGLWPANCPDIFGGGD